MINVSSNYAVYETLFFVLDLTNTEMVGNREFVSEKFDVDRTCTGASRKSYSSSSNNNNNNNNNNNSNTSPDRVNGCKQYQIMSSLGFKQMTTKVDSHNTSP
jgi:hypothetical protein